MTVKVFPGTSDYGYRGLFFQNQRVFNSTMAGWPSLAFNVFVVLLYALSRLILKLYFQTEATFPEGTKCLMEKVEKRTPGTTSPPSAFPGAEEGVKIHSQLQDMISKTSSDGNLRQIKFASVKLTTD